MDRVKAVAARAVRRSGVPGGRPARLTYTPMTSLPATRRIRTPDAVVAAHDPIGGGTSMMRLRWLVAVAMVTTVAAGTPAAAQTPSVQVLPTWSDTVPAANAGAGGPTRAAARVGAQAEAATTAEAPALFQGGRTSRGVPLMIVGGAALLLGAIIGGDPGTIVMVGGAGIGLYGLYLFLQ